jgi:hypothetical protein
LRDYSFNYKSCKSMKYAAILLVLFLSTASRSQIVLEHLYENPEAFGLIKVDSNDWKYVCFNMHDTIQLYHLDHTLDRIIVLPSKSTQSLVIVAKNLFDLDGKYQCMTYTATYPASIQVFREDGTVIFRRDSAHLGSGGSSPRGIGMPIENQSGLIPTKNGTKMILWARDDKTYGRREIYSLPGKLPESSSSLAVNNPYRQQSLQFQLFAYPNPSRGRTRIAYELPLGVSQGEIVLSNEVGLEIRRFRVSNAFNDILIDQSNFVNGTYFYKLVTSRGESSAKAISIMR